MSILVWAGAAIDPETQGEKDSATLSNQIQDMLAQRDEEPFTTVNEHDGSELQRYLFGRFTFTDIIDRRGSRAGFGIIAGSPEEAARLLGDVQALFNNWGIDVLASVWKWDHATAPLSPPMEVEVAT